MTGHQTFYLFTVLPFYLLISVRHFQSYYRNYQRGDKEHPSERGRFFEKNYACYDSANRANARPHWIGRAYRDGVYGFCQKHHAQCKAGQESGAPSPVLRSCCFLHLAQTEGKARLEQSCYDKYNPVHNLPKGLIMLRWNAKVINCVDIPCLFHGIFHHP